MQENRFQLAGYLAAKPTLRSLPSSMPVANARLGQTYRFSRKDIPAEHTNWFSLVFYGDLAILATELEKGTNLYVEGTFDQRPCFGQDKFKRYIYEVTVHKFFVIGSASQDPPAPSKPHTTLANEVMTDGAPALELSETQDTWLL
ncbi:MAG: single-stranded DNA-binding protein [Acidobacteriales bacterium]|nr:single-stranded DNA-binding protein [Terriglobales bacterium]